MLPGMASERDKAAPHPSRSNRAGPTIDAPGAGCLSGRHFRPFTESLPASAGWRQLPLWHRVVSHDFEHHRQVLQRFGIVDMQRLSNLIECVSDSGDSASYFAISDNGRAGI